MSSQPSVSQQPPAFVCELCGNAWSYALALARHKDSTACRTAQARQARNPNQPIPATNFPSAPTSLPEMLLQGKRNRPTLRRIPAGAREACAVRLTSILTDCAEKNNIESWTELILFAPRMLHAPAGRKTVSLATSIKNNLQGIMVATDPRKPRKQRKRSTSDDQIRKQVDLKLQDGDVNGAVRLLATEDEIGSP